MGKRGSHVSHTHEARALYYLEAIIAIDRDNRDALPGSVVKLVKEAAKKLKKRQEPPRDQRRPDRPDQ